jgi:hypothetical protein
MWCSYGESRRSVGASRLPTESRVVDAWRSRLITLGCMLAVAWVPVACQTLNPPASGDGPSVPEPVSGTNEPGGASDELELARGLESGADRAVRALSNVAGASENAVSSATGTTDDVETSDRADPPDDDVETSDRADPPDADVETAVGRAVEHAESAPGALGEAGGTAVETTRTESERALLEASKLVDATKSELLTTRDELLDDIDATRLEVAANSRRSPGDLAVPVDPVAADELHAIDATVARIDAAATSPVGDAPAKFEIADADDEITDASARIDTTIGELADTTRSRIEEVKDELEIAGRSDELSRASTDFVDRTARRDSELAEIRESVEEAGTTAESTVVQGAETVEKLAVDTATAITETSAAVGRVGLERTEAARDPTATIGTSDATPGAASTSLDGETRAAPAVAEIGSGVPHPSSASTETAELSTSTALIEKPSSGAGTTSPESTTPPEKPTEVNSETSNSGDAPASPKAAKSDRWIVWVLAGFVVFGISAVALRNRVSR